MTIPEPPDVELSVPKLPFPPPPTATWSTSTEVKFGLVIVKVSDVFQELTF